MVESNSLFIQLAIVLGLSALIGYAMKRFRLPLVVAYLVAGVLLSFLQIFDTTSSLALTFLPEIGIAFVLFFVGMELDLKEIKYLGKPIVITSLAQIILSITAGFLITSFLGFPPMESFLLGVGLSFSSTIVVVKMLLEKKDLSSLYGKLSIGILLLEDLVAILLLMFLTVGSSFINLGLFESMPLAILFGKGALLLTLAFLSRFALKKILGAVANSAELLFLSALAWCFVFVAVSLLLGFSVVIGAFLAGVALANSAFHFEIQGKVKPLRDFFVTLFFVYLGSQVVFTQIGEVLPLIAIFTLYALILKPFLFLLILGIFGFRRHTIFQTSLNLSQISEFSLIVLMVGIKAGMVSHAALTAMALTGVISIIVSSIMITYSRQIYRKILPVLGFFEHGKLTHQTEVKEKNLTVEDHVVLIGAHRMGSEIVRFLMREKIPFLVVDFNPDIIQKMVENKIHALYGDIGDPEILEFLNLEKSRLVISSAQNLDDNLILLSEIKRRKVGAVIVVRATTVLEAEVLYKAGADYVILPEIVSGEFMTDTLKNHWPSLEYFKGRREVELNKMSRNHLAVE